MPGLNQLKTFVENAESLGDELTVRKMRKETIEEIKIPEGIPEADDSDDFLYGVPVSEEDDTDTSTESEEESSSNDEKPSAKKPEEDVDIDIDALLNQDINGNPLPTEPAADVPAADTAAADSDAMVDLGELPENDDIAVEDTAETTASSDDDFEMPDFSDMAQDTDSPADSDISGTADTNSSDVGDVDFQMPDFDLGDENNTDFDPAQDASSFEEPAPDTSAVAETTETTDEPAADSDDSFDLPDFDLDDLGDMSATEDSAAAEPAASDTPADTTDAGAEPDISAIDPASFDSSEDTSSGGLDIDLSDIATPSPGTDDLPDFKISDEDNPDDDLQLPNMDGGDDLDFNIPGFSDVSEITPPSPKEIKKAAATENSEDLQPNEFTDAEYKKFIENLNYYPLNLRIEIENLLIENQFNDEENAKIVRMVIKKTPVRQLASYVGKLIDKQIDVPRNYEKRTAAQYEAYKASAEYQLKNRILPIAFFCLIACMLGASIFYLGKLFVYEPIRAEILYKEGYELLDKGYFQQSQQKFLEAVDYKAKRNWFYTYARGYRDRRQYGMAAQMYKWLLICFPKDKNAGLEYAEMELYDLQHYEEAETIVRREVLDKFINDQDAMLLLGDVYLEWATNEDPSKFEQARQMYETVMQMYGQTDTCLARMLRYYIRTDNLREVLPLKSYFYPNKKTGPKRIKEALSAKDILELSSFLLNKLYGKLTPAEEYLRAYIEDVRDLLEQAILADPSSPEAFYNYARYFMYTANLTNAQTQFAKTLQVFSQMTTSDPKLILMHVDSYRLLGELYKDQQEYLKAEELYTEGISLFEAEKEPCAIVPTADVGKLYADMADIDYFISGDTDQALRNYERSVEYRNDTSSIRYRIGYIQYGKKNYLESVTAFIKSAENNGTDLHLLLALGNALSLRKDNFAAQGYYERFMAEFAGIKQQMGRLFPQAQSEDADLVENYMYAANNYGVALSNLAAQTGNSNLNAQAMVYLSEAMRAWDSLTRNPETLIRLEGSNLAAQNMKYLAYRQTPFEPALYFDIPRTLQDEEILTQPSLTAGR